MKTWQRLSLRIDALSLRERVIIFVMVVLVLSMLMNALLLDPQFARQTAIKQQLRQQQAQIADMQNQIQERVALSQNDPDETERARLKELSERVLNLNRSLSSLQNGLVSPDRMADLLESMLKRNQRLQLVSLKTLPVTGLNEAVEPAPASGTLTNAPAEPQVKGVQTVFKHTVELKVQGNYLDMLDYMRALEGMQWQVFWGSAQLQVESYPTATLTLTLFTLSLDKKWLNL